MEYVLKGKLSLEDYTNFNRAAILHKKSYFLILLICFFAIFSSTISSIIKNPRVENIIAQLLPVLVIFAVYFLVFKIFRNSSNNLFKFLFTVEICIWYFVAIS